MNLLLDSTFGHPLECAVCLERMKDVSFLSTQPDKNGLVCEHFFCTKCIQSTYETAKAKGVEPTCPSCRRPGFAVLKSRIANELIGEIEKERDERKRLVACREAMEKELEQTKEILKRREEEYVVEKQLDIDEAIKKAVKEAVEAKEAQTRQALKKLQGMYEQKLTAVNAEKDNLQSEVSTLTTKVTALKVTEALLPELKEKVKVLQSELEKERSEKSKQEGKAKLLKAELEANYKTVQGHVNTITERDNKIEALKVEQGKLSTKVSLLEKEATIMRRDLDEKTAECEKWKKHFQQAREETKQVQDKSAKADSGYSLSSWFPTSPTSLYSYFKLTPRTGKSIINGADVKFIERRGTNIASPVWQAKTSNPERTVALKKIDTKKNPTDAFRQAMLLEKLDHKNILKLVGVLRDTAAPGNDTGDFIALPFVAYDLEFALSEPNRAPKGNAIRKIMYELLSAVYYLHTGDIVHRDIRPASILIDESFQITLGGFSQARSVRSTPLPKLQSTRYTAPENIYMNDQKSLELKASDIWSLGVIFAELFRDSPLFDNREKALSQIFSLQECRPTSSYIAKYPVLGSVQVPQTVALFSKLKDAPQDALDLLEKMLQFDPLKRITAAEALQHKYFTDSGMTDVHKTCAFGQDLVDSEIQSFVETHCGGW